MFNVHNAVYERYSISGFPKVWVVSPCAVGHKLNPPIHPFKLEPFQEVAAGPAMLLVGLTYLWRPFPDCTGLATHTTAFWEPQNSLQKCPEVTSGLTRGSFGIIIHTKSCTYVKYKM